MVKSGFMLLDATKSDCMWLNVVMCGCMWLKVFFFVVAKRVSMWLKAAKGGFIVSCG